MNCLLAEYLDFDIGKYYTMCPLNFGLEVWGSWDDWKSGVRCCLGVRDGRFFGFGLLTLPRAGSYEYKYKFTGKRLGRIESSWFHDLSRRATVGVDCYRNQILCTDDPRLYDPLRIPIQFDRLLENESVLSLVDVKKHLNCKLSFFPPGGATCIACLDELKTYRECVMCVNKHFVCLDCFAPEGVLTNCYLCRCEWHIVNYQNGIVTVCWKISEYPGAYFTYECGRVKSIYR